MKYKNEIIKFIIIVVYMVINALLITHNINCLSLDVLTKLLERMNDNPSKSGVILQLLYFCMVAYFEYPYDYSNEQPNDQLKEQLIADKTLIEVNELKKENK